MCFVGEILQTLNPLHFLSGNIRLKQQNFNYSLKTTKAVKHQVSIPCLKKKKPENHKSLLRLDALIL